MDAALYDLFWENSKLGPVTVRGFSKRIEEYAATEPEQDQLRYPGAAVPLRRPRDGLARTMESRRSERAFAAEPMPQHRLGEVFAGLARGRRGARPYASAGGTYPLEVFALLPNVSGPLRKTAVHYDPFCHALTAVTELPPWDEYRDAVNLDNVNGVPHAVVVFALFPERTTAKYGERGGRFALIEVGHAAQNLALRLARAGMAGCEIGGLFDERVKALLRLEGTSAQIVLGFACGLRAGR